jgi:hypothetical protein
MAKHSLGPVCREGGNAPSARNEANLIGKMGVIVLIVAQTSILRTSGGMQTLHSELSFAFYSIGKVRKIGLESAVETILSALRDITFPDEARATLGWLPQFQTKILG